MAPAVMRTVADYRQLNDALFHAGLRSGSQFEWEDAANRLHFYVIDIHGARGPAPGTEGTGILSYTVAVRSLDGKGPQTRGVALNAPATQQVPGAAATWSVTLRNTGIAARTDPALHPQDASSYLRNDIYRLSVAVDGQGWSAEVQSALAAVPFGESTIIPVHIMRTGKGGTAKVTLTAVSESDPAARGVVTTTASER